ncbi:MAG: glutaredoxin family protein [Alphaproteobacteria bacterium]
MDSEIVLYVTPLCAPCERIKAYLRSRGVDFSVKDLMMDEAAAEFLESRNIRSSPVLRVGDDILAGVSLNTEKIDALLGL